MKTILKTDIPTVNDEAEWEYSAWGVIGKKIVWAFVDSSRISWMGEAPYMRANYGYRIARWLVSGFSLPGYNSLDGKYYRMRYLKNRSEVRVFEISYKQFLKLQNQFNEYADYWRVA